MALTRRLMRASLWDEPPVRHRFGPAPGPRIRVLIAAGEDQELIGPTIAEEDARQEIGAPLSAMEVSRNSRGSRSRARGSSPLTTSTPPRNDGRLPL